MESLDDETVKHVAEPQPVSTGYAALVRHNADFRWLWSGQVVSLLGDWFNLIASIALITSLTESGIAVGSLFVIRMLAPFLTSPIAGVVADRFRRRNILIAADVIRGVVVAGMLLVRSTETVWLLYVLTALQMGTSSFFFTARNAILPDIVDASGLGTANAISAATWSVMLAVGAALGGLTAGWLGIYTAFTIDAATFFLSAALVAQIRRQPSAAKDTRFALRHAWRDYAKGLQYLGRHPDLLAIALHKVALTMLLGTTFRVVQSAVAERVFPIGQQGGIAMGLMFAAAGIGTGVGPIVARYFTGDHQWRLRLALVLGYLLGGLGVAISSTLWSFPTMLVGAFIGGTGNGMLWVFSTQLLLQLVDDEVRGRVFGTEFAMFALGSAVSSAAVGIALDSQLGISGVLVGMAALSLVPATAWSVWLVFQRRLEVGIERARK
jgi:MFS family permease